MGFSNHYRWISGDYCEIRHIFRNDTSCSYNSTLTDSNALENDTVEAYPRIIFNNYNIFVHFSPIFVFSIMLCAFFQTIKEVRHIFSSQHMV